MATVMHLLLIRLALIVGGVVVLIVAGFTVAVILKRGGRLTTARRYALPVLRALAERPGTGRPAGSAPGRPGTSGGARRAAVRAFLRYLDDAPARNGKGTGE